MPRYTLGMYFNGARGIRATKDLQDVAAQNIETILTTLSAGPSGLPCFRSIPVRYSRDNDQYCRPTRTGGGCNVVKLWNGIRDFELRALGENKLSPTTGADVNAPPYYMLTASGLQSFAQQVMTASTGDETALWLWGHGQGPGAVISINLELLSQPNQPAYFQQPIVNHLKALESEWLTPGEIELALKGALPSGKFLGVIIFESCSVCTLELASSLHTSAKFAIASQAEILSEGGWNYSSWPNVFCTESAYGANVIAIGLVTDYMKEKSSKSCVSALDLTHIPGLLEAIGTVADKALADTELATALLTARKRCLATHTDELVKVLGAKQRVDIAMLFSDAVRLLRDNPAQKFTEFAVDCRAVVSALERVVIKNGATPDLRSLVNGLSIWFPASNDKDCVTEYSKYVYFADTTGAPPELNEFKKRTRWDQLLKKLIPAL